ncbi:hypothetical protein FXO37_09101 [Capsicum annuum]|nr:hypothetical protein FXO37_09101 [Capsicum annuum]
MYINVEQHETRYLDSPVVLFALRGRFLQLTAQIRLRRERLVADDLYVWILLLRRIKEFYRWPGDIRKLPMYLKHAMDSKDSDLNSSSTQSEGIEDEMKAAAQDIASYQVVLSRDVKIVEFQRTNRGAENQRAASPLVKELYGKKKHSHNLFH